MLGGGMAPQPLKLDQTLLELKLGADTFCLFLNMSKGHVKLLKQLPNNNISHSILINFSRVRIIKVLLNFYWK